MIESTNTKNDKRKIVAHDVRKVNVAGFLAGKSVPGMNGTSHAHPPSEEPVAPPERETAKDYRETLPK